MRSAFRTELCLFLSLLAGLSSFPASAQTRFYSIAELDPGSNATASYAVKINSSGVVVGEVYRSALSRTNGYIYSGGAFTEFTAFGLSTYPSSINDSGWITGTGAVPGGSTHAFLLRNGDLTDLGSLSGPGVEFGSVAHGINAYGQVVGWSNYPEGPQHAFFYSDGVMRDLGTRIGDGSIAWAINDSGLIVGQSAVPDGSHAFSWFDGTAVDLAPDSYWSGALAVNNAAQVAGFIVIPDPYLVKAFVFESGFLRLLDHPAGRDAIAKGINEAGWIVGYANSTHMVNSTDAENGAWIANPSGVHDLQNWLAFNSGWTLKSARSINGKGQIVGWGRKGGKDKGFLLTPPDYQMMAGPAQVQAGTPITVAWNANGPRAATDWIGMYKVGDPDSAYREYRYSHGTQYGSVTFEAPTPAGSYEFRYFTNNSYTRTGISNPVTTFVPSGYSVSASPLFVDPGQSITVTWRAPAAFARAKDWIGLYRVGAANRQWVQYVYTNGAASGTATFQPAGQAGAYEFRYLFNDRFVDLARSNQIQVNAASYSVTPSALTSYINAELSVSWTGPAGSSSLDWIGLYKEGEADNRKWLAYRYTGGAANGSVTFQMPAPKAERYVFRYLLNNGYTAVAQSVAVSVQSPYSLVGSPSYQAYDYPIYCTWQAPVGASYRDWIAVYRVGDPDDQPAGGRMNTDGATRGTRSLYPPTVATLEFRYFAYIGNNRFTLAAVSNPIVIYW